MNRRTLFVWTIAAVVAAGSHLGFAESKPEKKKLMFFSPSLGFRHSVVTRPLTGELAYAEKEFRKLAAKAGFEVDVSQDYHDLIGPGEINRYDAIVLYTSGKDLPLINKNELLKWLKNGGALIGIHSATDTYHDWPEFGKLMGGYFLTHGHKNDVPVVIKNENPDHPATRMLGEDWTIADEIYQFREDAFPRGKVQMLLSIDTSKMDDAALENHKMTKGGDYPVAWTNTCEQGRIFYTSLGHREDVWTNPKYQEHLMAGIKWALKISD